MSEITGNPSDLAPGRYIFEFSYPFDLSEDVSRKISDYVNLQNGLVNGFADALTHYHLEGVTVRPSTRSFFALVTVTGTPLLVIVEPIIQAILILTAGYVLLTFIRATAVGVSSAVTDVGAALKDVGAGVKDVGAGVKDVGTGIGNLSTGLGSGLSTGLKYGLPIAAGAVALIAIALIFGGSK
jgi:hypothetical protein